jgi:hypothetical protein
MIAQLVSLALSFLLMWSGRDKVWTPTFEGTREARFTRAVVHYQQRMGLGEDPLVFEISPTRRVVNGRATCAWVTRDVAWGDVIGFSSSQDCTSYKPEYLALHEQCHRRMAHLDVDVPDKHAEVKTCMGWYSEKERR